MNPVTEYWQRISSGKVTVCKKVRRVYQKLQENIENPNGEWYYDERKAGRVIEFLERFCKQSKGAAGGQFLRLDLWQKAFIAATYGFVSRKTGLRKYREAMLIVARKNGKSTIGSGLGNYMLFGDGERGPEVVSAATKKDQAKIVWAEAKRMIKKSPALNKRSKCLVGEIDVPGNDGTFKPLSSDSNTLDGLNIHCAIIDELHAVEDMNLYDVLVDGMTAREQPLCLIISTAGTVREGIYDQKYSEAQDIIQGYDDGVYKDERRLCVIYELDNRSEWEKPDCWVKANPGLGTIKSREQLAEKVKRAQHNPALVKNLLCKDFNIRETSYSAWLPFEDINNTATFDVMELAPRYGIGGADLSSTTDLTCATILFKKTYDGVLYVLQMYWLPEGAMERMTVKEQKIYSAWIEQGYMRLSAGSRVQYSDVTAWFLEMQQATGLNILWCGYDSWSANYWVQEMAQYFGQSAMEAVIQGKKTLSAPMKNMGADLTAKRINYNNNPILKWCLTNTAVDIDRNGNIQPLKSNQRRRIDGTASLLDAYVALERHLDDYNNLTL